MEEYYARYYNAGVTIAKLLLRKQLAVHLKASIKDIALVVYDASHIQGLEQGGNRDTFEIICSFEDGSQKTFSQTELFEMLG